MSHVWAVLLGIAQGVAEFLPISSTAHLKLIPWLFGIEGRFSYLSDAHQASAFDIALHAGSFVAIVLALWPEWLDLFRTALGRTSGRPEAEHPAHTPAFARRFLGFLLVTSVPGALFGVAFDDKIETFSTPRFIGADGVATGFAYAPLLVGVCLITFGIVLWAVDRFVSRQEPLDSMSWVRAAVIGLAQALALIPGVSRSGSTMTAGRALGLSRDATAKYSFMAAAPIIGGAAVFGLRHVPLAELLSVDWVLGFVASAIASAALMRWMLAYVRRHSFSVFMWYRIIVGVAVIGVFLLRG